MALTVTDEISVKISGDPSGGTTALRAVAAELNSTAERVARSEQELTRVITLEKARQERAAKRSEEEKAKAAEMAQARQVANARKANAIVTAIIARGDPLRELRARTRREIALYREAAEKAELTESQKQRAMTAIARRYAAERRRIQDRDDAPAARRTIIAAPVAEAQGFTLRPAIAAIGGFAAVTAGATLAVRELVNTTREFDILNAGLTTSTGSAEEAGKAFAALQDLATETPYSLIEVTNAFNRLVNYGLTPSERALVSYGNTAAAMGKNLDMVTDAVADATTGEFERLKEFGIKAKKEGDQVSFTFRGMTETVAFNAREIEEYMIRLGEVNFADAMSNRMASLDGALSNFGDAWDQLVISVSRAGLGEAVESSIRGAITVFGDLQSVIEDGEAETAIGRLALSFKNLAEDASTSVNVVKQAMESADEETAGWAGRIGNELYEAFIGSQLEMFAEGPIAPLQKFVGGMTVTSQAAIEEIHAFATLSGKELDSELERIGERYEQTFDETMARYGTVTASMRERLAAEQEAALALAAQDPIMQGPVEYDNDRLAKYRKGGDGSDVETDAEEDARKEAEKRAEKARKAREKELEEARELVAESEQLFHEKEVLREAESEAIGKVELKRQEELTNLEAVYAAKIELGEADLEWEREYLRRRAEINEEARRETEELQAKAAEKQFAESERQAKRTEAEAEKLRRAAEQELAKDEQVYQAGLGVGFSFIRGMKDATESGEAEDMAKAFLGLIGGIISLIPGGGIIGSIIGGIGTLFHDGTTMRDVQTAHDGYIGSGPAGSRPGTRRLDVLTGESVLNPRATAAMGGSAGVANFNRTQEFSMGGFSPRVDLRIEAGGVSIQDLERRLPEILRRAMIASKGPVEQAFVQSVGKNFGR